ncbi:hypothetical protein FDF31_09665 [Clostridium sporogenes]|nr:hypothetical protein [Clostridium botulinum]NFN88258.1 hypothetical protein [Clostridium sporogenes]NFS25876.1 hypothetical protein [Clostridium sporogenes]
MDIDKVKAIESFIESEEDICIFLVKINDYFISMDGHTGLYYVIIKGYSKVRTYFTEPEDCLEGFVEEARKRKVYSLIN